jgi:hypothetical protein
MAEMNLLKANFTGSVGVITGATWKGKPVVKARIFSKAPPSTAQTNSVRSFEALNRISSQIAKLGFAELGLSAKNMLPHNAVARFLKPIVKDHEFAPANAEAKIPNDGSLKIVNVARESSTSIVTVSLALGTDYIPFTGSKMYLIFFDQTGQTYFSYFGDPQDLNFQFYLPFSDEFVYDTMAFISDPAPKGRVLHGFQIEEGFGMQYSLTEQITPDIWLDGKPVYQITIQGNVTAAANTFASSSIVTGRKIGTLIRYWGTFQDGLSGFPQTIGAVNFSDYPATVSLVSEVGLGLFNSCAFRSISPNTRDGVNYSAFTVTLQYTKY